MSISRVVEYVFFFVILVSTGILVWQVMAPFATALALSIIIVTICYPLYEQILKITYKNSPSLASFLTTLLIVFLIVLPLFLLSSLFVREVVSFYNALGSGQQLGVDAYVANLENMVAVYIPGFELNITSQLRLIAEGLVGNIGAIFAGTISTVLIFVISLFGSFYFFKDGKEFLRLVIKISPLPDKDDNTILCKLAKAVRSVATGVVLVALIQGVLAGIGFAMFGIERSVLWGAVASITAMIPGVGTFAVMAPAVAYLFFTSTTFNAVGLLLWGVIMVGMVDNILGPKLMSRGNNLHPFIILISVLGGVAAFGPIGFIIGPVIITLFISLLDVYNQYLVKDSKRKNL